MNIISEKSFEECIDDSLVSIGGYSSASGADWNQELALNPVELFAFLKSSQPEEWKKLEGIHGDQVETRFLSRLLKELETRGTLEVLRHGIIDYGVRFKLAFFRPATNLNEEALRLYELNRLTVTRQLHFSIKRPNDSVDIVLCMNGLPIATIELKNHFTQQRVKHAIQQYMSDRDPHELLFQFKKRALVHFAVDPDEVAMTTHLNGKSTRFLPFNKGNNNAAGNPVNQNGQRTAYLWEEVLSGDSLLDLLGRFLHLQTEKLNFAGFQTPKKVENLIFPRYHQIDAVRKLEASVKSAGIGKNYLIQHSAGSGKSNTIAWLAHGLSSLHDAQDHPVFDSVIVITDRRVLDTQLQDIVFQFDHKPGVVQKIDKDSQQLADALKAGVKIIITTLQKFPFVIQHIDAMAVKNYALIVDEAHSSQSGDAAAKVKEVLTTEYAVKENGAAYTVEADEETAEDMIVRRMSARQGQHDNLSFFAFTATPKPKTLEVFGNYGYPDGKPRAFHLYSMRQAIEEGFILDVLLGYMTYKRFYALNAESGGDKKVDKKQASRAIARFVNLHPHNIAQKVELIVEHFRTFVMQKIGGQAKAMVVTDSRLMAVKYKQEVDHYLAEKGYSNIKALVAFSGTVFDDMGLEFTEPGMNGISERELVETFKGEEYRLLLVAEKYQTGFDQPFLHTMYVDKRLSGVKAVQTLSRLNRICPGKEDTFVIDFVNEPEDIQASFQPYYEGTTIDAQTDPNLLYDLKSKLDGFENVFPSEVEEFAQVFFNPRFHDDKKLHASVTKFIDPAVERFRTKPKEEQDEYKSNLKAFLQLYGFLSQVMPFTDAELEKFYAYGRLLATKLRGEGGTDRWQIDDEVALEYYRLQKMSEGAIELEKSTEGEVHTASEVGSGEVKGEEDELANIIRALNERFGTEFNEGDKLFFQQIESCLSDNETLARQARQNTLENFSYPFDDMFLNCVVDRMEQNQEITDRIMNDEPFSTAVRTLLLKRVYDRLRG